eukprot:scaffold545456_cov14-Prasinocladus_malaysianus.AAC.1
MPYIACNGQDDTVDKHNMHSLNSRISQQYLPDPEGWRDVPAGYQDIFAIIWPPWSSSNDQSRDHAAQRAGKDT